MSECRVSPRRHHCDSYMGILRMSMAQDPRLGLANRTLVSMPHMPLGTGLCLDMKTSLS